MKIFNRNDFIEMSKKSGNPMISMYIPTSRQSTNAYQEDLLHFKNILNKAESELIEKYDLEVSEINKILEPGKSLMDNFSFWQHGSDMLACFLFNGQIETFKLPLKLESPSYFIGEKPMMLPMLPELADDGHYYILLLNLDQIRLYEATRNVIQEIDLDSEKVATSFTAEEKEIDKEQSLQAQGRVGNAGAMYHGHGGGSSEEKKVKILNYFHRMTNMLEPLLQSKPLPLFLAGVDYLVPIFRQASKYNRLMHGHISGAFSENHMMVLHQKSWTLAEPHFEKEKTERKANFNLNKSKGLASSNDRIKILQAAFTGGIETLFLNKNHQHVWGSYDHEKHLISFKEQQENGLHCLIDEASVKVIESKGNVYFLDHEEMPDNSQAAGIFRYPI